MTKFQLSTFKVSPSPISLIGRLFQWS